MFRTALIFVLSIGILAGFLNRPHATSSSREPALVLQNRDAQRSKLADVEVGNAPSFTSQDGSIELERGSDGHFYADVRINNASVHMLVDTGASAIALSRDDARMAGLATSIGMNDVVGEGADGAVHGEFVRLDKVELGPLTAEDMDAIVLNSGGQSLLGQSFLSKFSSVQIEGDKMVLR